jgi:hypothetical protein
VGQVLPVARRYRERGERLWVIELADGSRQYIPASWCTPFAGAENPPGFGRSPAEEDVSGRSLSPLSLAGLRDLASVARHLRERVGARREEHGDGSASERRRNVLPEEVEVLLKLDEHHPGQRIARVGQLSPFRSAPLDRFDRPDGPPTTPARSDAAIGIREEVRRA